MHYLANLSRSCCSVHPFSKLATKRVVQGRFPVISPRGTVGDGNGIIG